MIHSLTRTLLASLMGVVLSLDAFAQDDLTNPEDSYKGVIQKRTPEMILPQKVHFKAMATYNGRIIFLECDRKEDSWRLNNELSYGVEFNLRNLTKKNENGSFRSCLDDISYLFPSRSR